MLVIAGMHQVCEPFSLKDERMLFSKIFKSFCALDIQKIGCGTHILIYENSVLRISKIYRVIFGNLIKIGS